MAIDAFIWFKGGNPPANGETTDKTYSGKKAFEIHSFSFGGNNPVTIGSQSGGAGAGKVTLSPFSIMKVTDAASPALFANCCNGSHFDEMHVVLRKAGGSAIEFLKYDFTEVFVESIQWGGSRGDDSPTESVSFAYGTVAVTYSPQTTKGGAGTPITANWDLTQNLST